MIERYKDRHQLNFDIIKGNLDEAIAQLKVLSESAASKNLREGELLVDLQHAYHHLNFAWHIRHVTTRQYQHLTPQQFRVW